ncbi:isochorismatase [Paenibacillus selenitireducens]|uniref:Isochorismatase n=1 Tax=Paenibacillus selenitireducens TaxID=1324314 RepID=A0A1T2X1F5_9BACL|nr:isochorismatase family cysteine hydrolase [Paenibacillus selenitireducens]OPA73721.1 isochorismatase [Paenibacillus selenitireducens]
MKLALLVIDMQNVFLQEDKDRYNVGTACEYINHVAGLLREHGHVVIHVQDVEDAGTVTEEELDFIPEIYLDQRDLRLTKEKSNAFWDTQLERILVEQGVGLVVVAGFAAEHCVLFTYNGAMERGFKAAILQKGIVSSQPEAITATYRDRHVVSYPVIDYLVNHT